MYRNLSKAWRRLRHDERGNIFILFAATTVPLFLFMGGAIDFTRYTRYKNDLANAVDAAALALARRGGTLDEDEATDFVASFVNSFPMGDSQFAVESYDVDKIDNGYRVSASGTVDAMFLPLSKLSAVGVNLDALEVNVVAEVATSARRIELALAFDNTGSMNCGNVQTGGCAGNWSNPGPLSRIVALRAAAHDLIDTLLTEGVESEFVKIALVPFEGDVNVGPTIVNQAYAGNPPSWLEWTNLASSKYDGQNFGKFNFSTNTACTTGSTCVRVGHKWLFDKLTAQDANVKWAGCVEMRAEP